MELIHIREVITGTEDNDLSDLVTEDGFHITQETVRTKESKLASLKRRISTTIDPMAKSLLQELVTELESNLGKSKSKVAKYFDVEAVNTKPEAKPEAAKPATNKYFILPDKS